MKSFVQDYRNFRMLADQTRWLAFQNALRAALSLPIVREAEGGRLS